MFFILVGWPRTSVATGGQLNGGHRAPPPPQSDEGWLSIADGSPAYSHSLSLYREEMIINT
jgi:hypothetical protein